MRLKRLLAVSIIVILSILNFSSCKNESGYLTLRQSRYYYDSMSFSTPLLRLNTNGTNYPDGKKIKYTALYNVPDDSTDYLAGIYHQNTNQFEVVRRDLSEGEGSFQISIEELSISASSMVDMVSPDFLVASPSYIVASELEDVSYCGSSNFHSHGQNQVSLKIERDVWDSAIEPYPNFAIGTGQPTAGLGQVGTTKWRNVYVGHQMEGTATSKYLKNMILAYENQYVQFFVDESYFSNQYVADNLKILGEEFGKGYEQMVKLFAEPSDLDNNGHIIFVFHDAFPSGSSVAGYFFSLDLYDLAKELPAYNKRYISNEGEILYIPVSTITKGRLSTASSTFKANLSVLFHEFQHLLFNGYRKLNGKTNVSDSLHTWLQEGLSMACEAMMGNGQARMFNKFVQTFLQTKNSSLVEWNATTNSSTIASYGHSFLFVRYLTLRAAETGVSDSFIKQIYASDYADVRDIEEIMHESFSTLYEEFVAMMLLTGTGLTQDPKYNIPQFNGSASSASIKAEGFNMATVLNTIRSYNQVNPSFRSNSKPYSVSINYYPTYNDRYSGAVTISNNGNNQIKGLALVVDDADRVQDMSYMN